MLNQVIFVGRLQETPMLNATKNGKNYTKLIVGVTRTFKNIDGEYDVDNIPVKVFNAIATNVIDYCKKGDIIGVKGRLQMNEDKIEIIADKITFLSTHRQQENDTMSEGEI